MGRRDLTEHAFDGRISVDDADTERMRSTSTLVHRTTVAFTSMVVGRKIAELLSHG
jgi:hypothetical protein